MNKNLLTIPGLSIHIHYWYFARLEYIHANKLFLSRYEREQNDNALHISHEAKYEAFWEPFYVSEDDITPPHDERFIGYGLTRNSQVCLNESFKGNIMN